MKIYSNFPANKQKQNYHSISLQSSVSINYGIYVTVKLVNNFKSIFLFISFTIFFYPFSSIYLQWSKLMLCGNALNQLVSTHVPTDVFGPITRHHLVSLLGKKLLAIFCHLGSYCIFMNFSTFFYMSENI